MSTQAPAAPVEQAAPGYVRHTTDDGITVETNTVDSEEKLKESLGRDDSGETPKEREKREASEAASKLGKKGGEAAAKAKPIPPEKLKGKDETDAKKAEGKEAKPADGKGEEADEEKRKREDNPRYSAKARVEQATREARQHREQAQRLQQENEQLRRELNTRPANANGQPAEDPQDPRPQEDNFQSYPEYVDAHSRWSARQEFRTQQQRQEQEHHQREQQRQSQEQAQEYSRTWTERLEAFETKIKSLMKEDPQFWDSLSEDVRNLSPSIAAKANGQPVTPRHALADIIIRSENAPTLMRYFTEHDDEFQRIASLKAPYDLVWEMASLSTRLGAATASAPRAETSQTHPPPNPVPSGASRAADDIEYSENDSVEEHARKHNARRLRMLKAGRV